MYMLAKSRRTIEPWLLYAMMPTSKRLYGFIASNASKYVTATVRLNSKRFDG